MQNRRRERRMHPQKECSTLHIPPEKEYDAIAMIAAQVCRTPIAFISFIHDQRQWFKSKIGFDDVCVPPYLCFGDYFIEHPDEAHLIIADATADGRFDNYQATGGKPVSFCASVPVKRSDGRLLGVLCVIDHVPGTLDAAQIESLKFLAGCITEELNKEKTKKTAQASLGEPLLENESKYRSLFNYLPNVVMRTTMSGIIELISPACYSLLGYKPEELLGKPVNFLYANEADRQSFIGELNKNELVTKFRLLLRCKNGEIKTCSVNAQHYYSEKDDAEGIEGVITDITDLVKTKKEIQDTKDFYERILHSISADIAVMDENNHYSFLNRHAVKDNELRAWLIGKSNYDYCRYRNKPLAIAEARERMIAEAERTGKRTEWLEELKDAHGNVDYILRVIEAFEAHDGKKYKVGFGINVTKLKDAEFRLAQSERYLNSLIDSIPDLILRIDANGKYLDYRAAHADVSALDPSAFLGKTMHEVHSQQMADLHLQFVREALANHRTVNYEYEALMPDGKMKFFEARVTKISGGEVVSIVRDITQRKENEQKIRSYMEQLQEREERLEHLITSAPDGIIVIDQFGKIILWNPMSEQLFGWRMEEVLGKSMSEIIMPERYRAAHENGIKSFLQTERSMVTNHTSELMVLKRSGTEFCIALTMSTAQQNGKTIFIAFVRDISEKKLADEALLKRERQLNEAQSIAKLASYEWDPETNRIQWSASVHSIFETDSTEDVERLENLLNYVHPLDLEKVLKSKENFQKDHNATGLEFRIITPAGEVKYVVAKGVGTHAESAPALVFGTLQDISEQKLFDRKLLEATIASEEKERNRIAAELHDGVCQDMAAALLTLSITDEMIREDISYALELIGQSKRALTNALELTRRVSHELLPKEFTEKGLVNSIEKLLNNLNVVDPINYSLKTEGSTKEPDPMVAMNIYRIVQAFIRNSQKHSHCKNVTISLHFYEEWLEVILEDDGRGFDLAKVKKKGIGFLTMSKRLETIGGRFDLKSKPKKGVQLKLAVPL